MTSRLLIRNLVIGAILTGVAYFAFLGHRDTETGRAQLPREAPVGGDVNRVREPRA